MKRSWESRKNVPGFCAHAWVSQATLKLTIIPLCSCSMTHIINGENVRADKVTAVNTRPNLESLITLCKSFLETRLPSIWSSSQVNDSELRGITPISCHAYTWQDYKKKKKILGGGGGVWQKRTGRVEETKWRLHSLPPGVDFCRVKQVDPALVGDSHQLLGHLTHTHTHADTCTEEELLSLTSTSL